MQPGSHVSWRLYSFALPPQLLPASPRSSSRRSLQLNTAVPSLATSLIANYLGISVAYWLDFGLSFVDGDTLPYAGDSCSLFSACCASTPGRYQDATDSPRYLASVGKTEEAREVLQHIRGSYDAHVEQEFDEIAAMAQHTKPSSPIEFVKIILGMDKSHGANLGRRAWLCIWLQIMASWSGITAVTAYSPVLLVKPDTAPSSRTALRRTQHDRHHRHHHLGTDRRQVRRRACLMAGAAGLAIVKPHRRSLYEASRHNTSLADQIAPAAVTMLFLFNLIYAATWGTVAFLIPTEIFPSKMRAQGNGFASLAGPSAWE